MCLGVVGFYLGARRLGVAVVVLAMVVGLFLGGGYIPNLFLDDGGADGIRRGLEER